MHISALKLPEGVKPTTTERDFTVATIVGRAAEEAGPAAAAAAEPGAAEAAAPAEAAEEKDEKGEGEEEEGLVPSSSGRLRLVSVRMKR